jgi:hypothetical protein
MTKTTCSDQPTCHVVLAELGIAEVFRPLPGQLVCDGIVQLKDVCWLVGTNDRGRIVLHFLEDATKAEAWAFFDSLRGGKPYINSRITVCGPSVPSPSAN